MLEKSCKSILIIKPSSLGDIFHVFPALSELINNNPSVEVDWFVDDFFKSAVSLFDYDINVIAFNRRRLKNINKLTFGFYERFFVPRFFKKNYDIVIDLSFRRQDIALVKRLGLSVTGVSQTLLERFKGERFITDVTVSQLYDDVIDIDDFFFEDFVELPYVKLYRVIFSKIGGYSIDFSKSEFGELINKKLYDTSNSYVVFFHSTSGKTKNWNPESWTELGRLFEESGYKVLLPWGSVLELKRAKNIAEGLTNAEVLPKLTLQQLVEKISRSSLVVGCDTGLTHLSSLLGAPTIRLWFSTSKNAGIYHPLSLDIESTQVCSPCGLINFCSKTLNQKHLPPCYESVLPIKVFQSSQKLLQIRFSNNGGASENA